MRPRTGRGVAELCAATRQGGHAGGWAASRAGIFLWLFLLQLGASADAPEQVQGPLDACSVPGPLEITFGEDPKVTARSPTTPNGDRHCPVGRVCSVWHFPPPDGKDLRITVTPDSRDIDPDIKLHAFTKHDSSDPPCKLVMVAQDFGGDMLVVNASDGKLYQDFWLSVACRKGQNCSFHLSFLVGASDEPEEIGIGETRSGVAIPGTPLHYTLKCDEACAKSAPEGDGQSLLSISAWPRDATSKYHLSLLVQKDKQPTTATNGHLKVSNSWFSGEVASIEPTQGTYYITVVKRHGANPLPFVLSARLPSTVQQLTLGKPTFGSFSRGQIEYFSFMVEKENSDIGVYITTFDGDPDFVMSHKDVNPFPTTRMGKFTWRSRKVGDDEMIVPPGDANRKGHETGEYRIGVHGYRDSAFSIIVLTETHFEQDDPDSAMIDWMELWLGLPQTATAQPGRPARFLYYHKIHTPRLFLDVETTEGERPDTCVMKCGHDLHCPFMSPLDTKESLNGVPDWAMSSCNEGKINGSQGERGLVLNEPCNHCWYAVLTTNAAAASKRDNKTSLRMLLGAEGRAHPLVVGEPFRGHVDFNSQAVLLSHEVTESVADEWAKANATLKAALTPVYGDPMFTVRKGAEDGPLIFQSNVSTVGEWHLSFNESTKAERAGMYYFVVRATSKHAQFRMQLSWDTPSGWGKSGDLADGRDSEGALLDTQGLPVLLDGEEERGVLTNGRSNFYTFRPVVPAGGGNAQRPNISISVVYEGRPVGIHVVALPADQAAGVRSKMKALRDDPRKHADWSSAPGEKVVNMLSTDKAYRPPGDGFAFLVAVALEEECAKNVWDPGWGSSPDARCTAWSKNATWGALKDNKTLATTCRTSEWAIKNCAAVCCQAPYTVFASTCSTEALATLSATGQPVMGSVQNDQYRRYRVPLSQAGQHLAVALALEAGDADLYVSNSSEVSRVNSPYKSDMVGNDVIFVKADDKMNVATCSQEVINKSGECAMYVAVLGTSKETAEYELSAYVPLGAPRKIHGSGKFSVAIPPSGGWEYVYQDLSQWMRTHSGKGLLIQVMPGSSASGTLASMAARVSTLDMVVHPESKGWSKPFVADGDNRLVGASFAGVWRIRMEAGDVEAKCKGFEPCGVLIGVNSSGSFVGRFVVQSIESSAHQAEATAAPLSPGVPMHGSMKEGEYLSYTISVKKAPRSTLSVSVTPQSNCTPYLWVDFPAKPGEAKRPDRMAVSPRTAMRFIDARIGKDDPRYRPGVHYLSVKQTGLEVCEFDIRAEEIPEAAAQGSTGFAKFNILKVGSPVFSVDNGGKQHFVYTVPETNRSDAEVRVTVITGDLEAKYAILVGEGDSTPGSTGDKASRLKGALDKLKPMRSVKRRGAEMFSKRNFTGECGESKECQVIVQVRGTRASRPVDFSVAALDHQAEHKHAEVMTMGLPIQDSLDERTRSWRYQLMLDNPSDEVRLRLTCKGDNAKDECGWRSGRLLLTADARSELPAAVGDRFYSSSNDFRKAGRSQVEGVLEIRVIPEAKSSPGRCQQPCMLNIVVEFNPAYSNTKGGKAPHDEKVEFELVAVAEGDYAMLVDGDDAVSGLLSPSMPELFLFDARRHSPHVTIVATFEYDAVDPHLDLVTMYGLPCATTTNEEQRDALRNHKPTRDHWKYKGFFNAASQLVLRITPEQAKLSDKAERLRAAAGNTHCYFRIALYSNRLKDSKFTIRGFDAQRGIVLPVGETLPGIVDGRHRFSFELEQPARPLASVALSFQVCAGNLRLRTANRRPPDVQWTCLAGGPIRCSPWRRRSVQCLTGEQKECLRGDGSDCEKQIQERAYFSDPLEMDCQSSELKDEQRKSCAALECDSQSQLDVSDSQMHVGMDLSEAVDGHMMKAAQSQWIEVTSRSGRGGSYLLLVEDPASRTWLVPKSGTVVSVNENAEGVVRVSWGPAALADTNNPDAEDIVGFFHGQGRVSAMDVEYEVVWMATDANSGQQLLQQSAANIAESAKGLYGVPGNTSSACGLYHEINRGLAQRVNAKSALFVDITEGLQPGRPYLFNVIARSPSSGRNLAYLPAENIVLYGDRGAGLIPATIAGAGSVFRDQVVPFVLILLSVVFIAWARPCCKGRAGAWVSDIELPRWRGGGFPMDARTFATPSVFGQSMGGDGHSDYAILR